jgi:hypothetical protein
MTAGRKLRPVLDIVGAFSPFFGCVIYFFLCEGDSARNLDALAFLGGARVMLVLVVEADVRVNRLSNPIDCDIGQ